MTSVVQADRARDTLAHQALFYRGSEDYLDGVGRFLEPGMEADEPIALAVPRSRATLLRDRLSAWSPEIELLDMVEVGRNPARIIPSVHALLAKHNGRMLHYVSEPIWPGRSAAEIREAVRHEALINMAWPSAQIRALCPYDAEALDDAVLADAERTHPWVIRAGDGASSPDFSGSSVPPGSDQPLSEPPSRAWSLRFGLEDLSRVRALVASSAASAGLTEERTADLVLAVNEVASNAIKHAGSSGLIRVWNSSAGLLCQLDDSGHITDPLAGRHPPAPGVDGGLGLWMVNQLCDLVEIRTSTSGTAVRVHMYRS